MWQESLRKILLNQGGCLVIHKNIPDTITVNRFTADLVV